jgi:hypothetical protein
VHGRKAASDRETHATAEPRKKRDLNDELDGLVQELDALEVHACIAQATGTRGNRDKVTSC